MRYAALLRGINVGGNVLVKMADLKTLLETSRLKEVKTILASGNVVFEAQNTTSQALERNLESLLKKKYGRDIFVLVRTIDELEKLEKQQPFKGIKVTKNTRLYVTFCREAPKGIAPKKHPGYRVLGVKGREILSVLELSPDVKTPDVMKIVGVKPENTTMRNWNTVQKIIRAA